MTEGGGRRYDAYLWLAAVPALFILGLSIVLSGPRSNDGLPVLSKLPNFNLTNQDGAQVGLDDLQGKIWVADFIFTTCAGPCPRMSSKMAGLQNYFRLHPEVRFVSYTVNPEYDTPEVLAQYAQRYGAQNDRWTFLTGASEDIHSLAAQGFKMGSMDTPLNHSTYFALVDGQGRLRGYYNSEDEPAINTLISDIQELLVSRE